MIDEFELKGSWWLPEKPEEKISGFIRFVPSQGAILDLIGTFKEIQERDNRIKETLKSELILGISLDGKKITLHKCFETNTTINTSYNSNQIESKNFKTSFLAERIFLGAHFERKEDIKFKELSVQYSYLDQWVNVSGFDFENHENNEFIIKYKEPESIQAVIDSDVKIFIDFPYSFSSSFPCPTIIQETWIRIEPSEEKSIYDLFKIMYQIQNFLSLGLAELVYPKAIEGKTKMNRRMVENICHYPPVRIFNLNNGVRESKRILPFQMFFSFEDIHDKFEYFVQNWFKKIELLGPIYNLYFGTLYSPNMNLENQFLNQVHALESYHRRVHIGEYIERKKYLDELYPIFVNSIPNNLDDDFRSSLKGKLHYLNEYSLRKRLKEIIESYSLNLQGIFGDKKAQKLFIELAADTRNYLTHFDNDLKEKAVEGMRLYYFIRKLRILVEICLLRELGFSDVDIFRLISKKYIVTGQLRDG